eukprot:GILI01005695.1.p1 GENE.GILI01005695.1~~GILI01005695.1.p1  ORF type:complete len:288 (+),score=114.75 GILI01005695.1:186-1049(+)
MATHKMMMDKLRKIEEACGGKSALEQNAAAGGDDFIRLKTNIAELLHTTLQDVRDKNALQAKFGSCKETIEKGAKIRDNIKTVEENFDELKRVYQQQVKKAKKLSADELERRGKLVHLLGQHISDLKDMERNGGVGVRLNLPTITESNQLLPAAGAGGRGFKSRGAGAGAGTGPAPERALTAEESSAIERFKRKDQELDRMIDDIDGLLNSAKDIALNIGEAAEKQKIMIDTLNEQAEKTGKHLNNINKKMKQTLQAVRGGDKLCMDFVLLAVLLGLIGYIYKQLVG